MEFFLKTLPLLTPYNTSPEAYLFAEQDPVTIDHLAIEKGLSHINDR